MSEEKILAWHFTEGKTLRGGQPLPFSFPSRVLNGRICWMDAAFAALN